MQAFGTGFKIACLHIPLICLSSVQWFVIIDELSILIICYIIVSFLCCVRSEDTFKLPERLESLPFQSEDMSEMSRI